LCNYNFELPVDPVPLMAMVQQMIEENGGRVTGQLPNVSMSIPTPLGLVAGNCHLVNINTVHLKVTKKPEVLTCAMVRDRLVGYIVEAVRLYSLQSEVAG
jgi:hypothetical protein